MSVLLAGHTPALTAAALELNHAGIDVTDHPNWTVTDVLLDVPTFRTGGITPHQLDTLLSSLPRQVCLWGGNLAVDGWACIDFLKEESYLWENAAITARCALSLTDQDWQGCSVLICGWGRIGTHLAKFLKEQGASVCTAVRKQEQLYRLRALGYDAVDYSELQPFLPGFHVVFNTVPCAVLQAAQFSRGCAKIDLASERGILGDDVIWARGLPGLHAPAESGKLIAKTFLQLRKAVHS